MAVILSVGAHPRSRGENLKRHDGHTHVDGSSPLTRGKLSLAPFDGFAVGLIPAHAGKTVGALVVLDHPLAHPRSRGENGEGARGNHGVAGSSPLTRGKRPHGDDLQPRRRLIPAHAGKTKALYALAISLPAHPRSRGENASHAARPASRRGSSPLTRGKPWEAGDPRDRGGLIPAHAGKTARGVDQGPGGPAHPRSRGENQVVHEVHPRVQGSSPLTRGKHALLDRRRR